MSTGREAVQPVEEEPGLEVAEGFEEEFEDEEFEDDEEVDEDGEEEEPPEETARETVERILKEGKEKAVRDEPQQAEQVAEPNEPPKQEVAEQPGVKPQLSKDFEPPIRFKANQKEAFHKAPKPVKEAIWDMVHDHEAKFHDTQRKLSEAQKEAQHIVEAVRPYLLANPELQEAGYTESKIVSGLIASHQKLTNPETAVGKWIEIGQQIGIDANTLAELQTAQGGVTPSAPANPEFQALQQQVNQLTSHLEQGQQQQMQSQVQSITSEMEAVRDEQDPRTGQFLRPELHEDAFIDQAKPLVSALVSTIPGISYGDALKRAHAQMTGRTNGNSSPQTGQARPPQANQSPQRATQGAVSVRGRGTPSSVGEVQEIPQQALGSAAESVKWALQQLRKG